MVFARCWCVLFFLACLACGSSQSSISETRDAGGDPDAGSKLDSGACGGRKIETVEGILQDERGQGIEDARAQVCIRVHQTDALVCLLPQAADQAGAFGVPVPDDGTQCVDRIAMRALLPGASFATTYCEIDLTGQNSRVQIEEPITLFGVEPAVNLPEEGVLGEARAVTFQGGLEVDVTPDRFFSEYDSLSARSVSPDEPGACFLPEDHGLEKLFALYPESDINGTFPVRVRMDRAPGTGTSSVALYVLGGLDCTLPDGTGLEEGDFVWVQTASVTEEGVAHFDLPCFNWFGVGRVPE